MLSDFLSIEMYSFWNQREIMLFQKDIHEVEFELILSFKYKNPLK